MNCDPLQQRPRGRREILPNPPKRDSDVRISLGHHQGIEDLGRGAAVERQAFGYRYYVSQSVLKGSAADGPVIARISAAEIEGVVIAQVRGLLRQPEVVLGAWRAARASAPDMTEDEARLALERLDPLWEELFPAEQARIIHLLVDRVDIGSGRADVLLKLEGLGSLARDLAAPAEFARAAA